LVRDVVRRVKSAVEIPVIAKLSSNVSSIVDIASSAERGGADAVTAINTMRAMAIDVFVKKPILANVIGGLSGPAIKPVAMRCVYEIYESVKIPIIAAGGVKDWRDAVEYFLAGASAVQIGTAIKTYGLEVFSLVASGIDGYMRANGYKEVSEIVGKAHSS
jgi:dihydroorotate dehydrogenase (NAD+) catalytic subunit